MLLGLIAIGVCFSVFVSKAFPFPLDSSGPISGLSLPSVSVAEPTDPVLTANVLPNTIGRDEFGDALAAVAGERPKSAPDKKQPAKKPPPLFQRYRAQPGDTASAIAARFGIELEYLLWNNSELRDGDFLAVGTTLYIPVGNGILHWVSLGETLSGIADAYGVPSEPIIRWPGNNLASPDQIAEGKLVFVPAGVPPVPLFVEPTPVPTEPPVLAEAPQPTPQPPQAAAPSAPPDVVSGAGMIWPYSCQLSRGFGGGHAGIDIDGVCNPSASIAAATSGTVISAVTSTFSGYGMYVDIRSPNGTVTRYAHLSSVHVSQGQQVSQGQTIGIIGRTGNSTGIHLHFEVRVGGGPVNPLGYLP